MQCPKCKGDSAVIDRTRKPLKSGAVRRRRVCLSCKVRWTTYERIYKPSVPRSQDSVDREQDMIEAGEMLTAYQEGMGLI